MRNPKDNEFNQLPELERYERFLVAWDLHVSVGFSPSQREANRVAAMFGVKAHVVTKQ